ncbi:MAG TPA: anaerobic ribonucleoside-triphosphate reductase activating protein [Candidatus Paceibacterota bacterium]|nr:anaerobic ribonucleoside-triphosphate reductase activating protein [Candidatus Paceibacterota bacterium]HRV32187.1 anaerobic ribonucleoside-triphosphate reductase activating protein [Candidatus Paceibacterota bacterium]
MIFGGFQQLSLIDYPGKICAIAFTIGCNFRCAFCHNKELVLPELIAKQPIITEDDILTFLKTRIGKLEALCITGGEPSLYDDLDKFLQKIKQLGLLIKLDTNGTNPTILSKILDAKLVDYIAMDIKAPLTTQDYNKITGVQVNLDNIKKSIELIKTKLSDYEFRTTVEPSLREQDILQIAKYLAPAKKYFLQEFRTGNTLNPLYNSMKGLSQDELEKIKDKIKDNFEQIGVR